MKIIVADIRTLAAEVLENVRTLIAQESVEDLAAELGNRDKTTVLRWRDEVRTSRLRAAKIFFETPRYIALGSRTGCKGKTGEIVGDKIKVMWVKGRRPDGVRGDFIDIIWLFTRSTILEDKKAA